MAEQMKRSKAAGPQPRLPVEDCDGQVEAGAEGEEMKQSKPPKGLWMITGVAVMIGLAAVIVGSTLQAPPSADDKRIFFVIGAGLSTVVLFLIAQVWRFLTTERAGD
jgi:hypothetical protein